jgi:hypothetical protein
MGLASKDWMVIPAPAKAGGRAPIVTSVFKLARQLMSAIQTLAFMAHAPSLRLDIPVLAFLDIPELTAIKRHQ